MHVLCFFSLVVSFVWLVVHHIVWLLLTYKALSVCWCVCVVFRMKIDHFSKISKATIGHTFWGGRAKKIQCIFTQNSHLYRYKWWFLSVCVLAMLNVLRKKILVDFPIHSFHRNVQTAHDLFLLSSSTQFCWTIRWYCMYFIRICSADFTEQHISQPCNVYVMLQSVAVTSKAEQTNNVLVSLHTLCVWTIKCISKWCMCLC